MLAGRCNGFAFVLNDGICIIFHITIVKSLELLKVSNTLWLNHMTFFRLIISQIIRFVFLTIVGQGLRT